MITAQIYELNLTIPAFGAISFGNLAQFRSAIWRNSGKLLKKFCHRGNYYRGDKILAEDDGEPYADIGSWRG